MDANANVKEMRQICRAVIDGEPTPDEAAAAASRMAELFEALDSWLLIGGFLPAEWGGKR